MEKLNECEYRHVILIKKMLSIWAPRASQLPLTITTVIVMRTQVQFIK